MPKTTEATRVTIPGGGKALAPHKACCNRLFRAGGILLALLALVALAIPSTAAAQKGFKHPVHPTAAFSNPSPAPGEAVRLVVTVDVDPGYHIYAMYLSASGPTATTIEDIEVPGWLEPLGEWKEPEPVVKFDKGFETDVGIHVKYPVEFSREYRVRADAPAGPATAKVRLTAQACTEESCLPPKKFPLEAAITPTGAPVAPPVAAPPPAPTPRGDAAATKAPPKGASGPASTAASAEIDRLGFGAFIAFSFAAGLVSLLTPCVFPMIPITISFFTKRASTTRKGAIRLAFTYGCTIIGAFGLFGFVVSIALRLLGQGAAATGIVNQIAANPWLNLALTGIFVAFAFSLFGMFDIGLPSGIADRLQKMKGNRTDTLGAMFMALIFVVVSFTCTAPIVGTLMITAVAGEWLRPLFGFLAYATGFALPFFGLALVPSALSSLPKSGGWLHSVKVVMGLLELAAATKFISNSDLVWRWGVFNREFVLASWVMIAAAATLYLLGKIRLPHDDEGNSISPIRLSWALLFGTFALVLAGGLAGGRLPKFVEAYLPPDLEHGASVVASGEGRELRFLPEFEEGVAEAMRTGKPLFVDFTGYTCTNCRYMEKNVFTVPAVHELLSERFVLVQLWTDDAKDGERHQEFQAERFGTIALPTYVLLSPDGKETLGVIGYTPDAKKFEEFLRTALR